tara:strand:- start:1456 stop:1968 length:513 start_codon:yes stop_codon:yes gene_type:complete
MENPQLMGTEPSPFKGLLIRCLAFIIDVIIIIISTIAAAFVFSIFFGSLFGDGVGIVTFIIVFILAVFITILYKPMMEASAYQATFGKSFLNMKIVDKNGRRITMTKSFVRTIVYILQITIPGINLVSWLAFLMIAFTEENQGLHDVVAETYVVSKYWQGPVPLQDNFGA